jgi:hypothetical protein
MGLTFPVVVTTARKRCLNTEVWAFDATPYEEMGRVCPFLPVAKQTENKVWQAEEDNEWQA